MVQIIKNEPGLFIDAKKKVTLPFVSSAWYELGKNENGFKTKLREYILLEEQNMLCVYCEKEIEADGDSSNTDHFKTRKLFPKETLNYDNLLVSCRSKFHCESIKDNFGLTCVDYKKIINPVIENPDAFFEYALDGDILIRAGLNKVDEEKAKFTIEVFELNNKSLQMDRRQIGSALNTYSDLGYELNDILDEVSSYPSFIKNIYKKIGELK